MKFLINLAYLIDLVLIVIFIGIPAWNTLVAGNITDPGEIVFNAIIIGVALAILSPITVALNAARKAMKK